MAADSVLPGRARVAQRAHTNPARPVSTGAVARVWGLGVGGSGVGGRLPASVGRGRVLGLCVAAALVVLGAACGSGSDSVPEPLPPPAPPPAPAPVSAAVPEPGPVGSLEDLVVTSATTGKDVVDRISESEASCIRGAVGDAVYGVLLGTPLLRAGINAAVVATLVGCLTPDNVVFLGVAFIDAQAGGWAAGPHMATETRMCIVEVGMERPQAILASLWVATAGEDAAAIAETHSYTVEIYNCMTDAEKVGFLVRVQDVLDSNTSAKRDIINVLPEPEAACVRKSLPEEEYAMLLDSTVHEAFATVDYLPDCVTPESLVQIFVSITASPGGGGLSDKSRSCLVDFAREHPHYVALINPGSYDPAAMAPSDLAEIADDGLKVWDCLSDEELKRIQGVATAALFGS